MEKTKIVAFSSLKGGTGKSSSTILVSKCFAASGKKVLVIDMDINNSCSFYFLPDDKESKQKNIAYALQSDCITDFIIPSEKNIDIIPSSLRLVDLRAMSTKILKNLLTQLDGVYDTILIDTAPTYDNIVLNAINASDFVLTPCTYDQFNFNTSIFLSQKLRLETEKHGAWFLYFNGFESRYKANAESLQNQYHRLYEQEPALAGKVLPIEFPYTKNVRKFIDTKEKLNDKGNTEKLHKAVCDLSTMIMGEDIRPERF